MVIKYIDSRCAAHDVEFCFDHERIPIADDPENGAGRATCPFGRASPAGSVVAESARRRRGVAGAVKRPDVALV